MAAFPRGKWLEHEADHSPPSSVEFIPIYTSTPPYIFMASCLIN
jgi:hypothetical protein